MDSLLVDVGTYKEVIAHPMTVFHSTDFNQLNAGCTSTVYHLLFRDKKYRVGMIAGVKEDYLVSPFSAPYGGFSFINITPPFSVGEVIKELTKVAKKEGLKGIRLTLPPLFYDPYLLSVLTHGLLGRAFRMTVTDLNNQMLLSSHQSIEAQFGSDGRRNLRIARKQEQTVSRIAVSDGLEEAYEVIRKNRMERGYPLHMSLEQVGQTMEVVPSDIFMCYGIDGKPMAAAIVFRVATAIAQVIYWGHLSEYDVCRPMYLLAHEVAQYYRGKGFRYLDIGPSTDQGVVNDGLYRFKQSIGCTASLKFTFEKTF